LGESGGRLQFRAQPAVDPRKLIHMLQREPKVYRLDGQDKLRITRELPDAESRMACARALLQALGAPVG
jgi:transcription-repair coupling factor (superfamily II helicase)